MFTFCSNANSVWQFFFQKSKFIFQNSIFNLERFFGWCWSRNDFQVEKFCLRLQDCFVRAREFLKLRRRKRSIWPQVAAKAFTIELRLEDQAWPVQPQRGLASMDPSPPLRSSWTLKFLVFFHFTWDIQRYIEFLIENLII